MESKELLGIKINNITKEELLIEIDRLILAKAHAYVVTPYSEFFLAAQKDIDFKNVLNSADISLPDGFGVALGLKYMKMNGRILPMIWCLFKAVTNRSFFKGEIKEKLSGSEIIFDVSALAAQKSYTIFLLGGFDFGDGNTGEITKRKLEEKYPGLKIVGTYAGSASEAEESDIIERINKANPDLLFVAYGPVKQEKWMLRNKNKLNPMISFGLGGTFDYVAGAKKKVPKWLTDAGLEGILRPFISERGNPILMFKRFKRAWGGILRFIWLLMRSK